MRNFEERKAEVFRRSENRIKERKRNRNRLLAICIPLCLILTVWSVTILPAMLPAGIDNAEQENAFDGVLGNTESFESVVIMGSNKLGSQTETITDSDRVTAIHCAILDLYNAVNAGTSVEDSDTQKGELKDEDLATGNSSAKVEYTICFTTVDGSEIRFVLNNNELRNENNDNRIQLSQEQLKEFLEFLELTD